MAQCPGGSRAQFRCRLHHRNTTPLHRHARLPLHHTFLMASLLALLAHPSHPELLLPLQTSPPLSRIQGPKPATSLVTKTHTLGTGGGLTHSHHECVRRGTSRSPPTRDRHPQGAYVPPAASSPTSRWLPEGVLAAPSLSPHLIPPATPGSGGGFSGRPIPPAAPLHTAPREPGSRGEPAVYF